AAPAYDGDDIRVGTTTEGSDERGNAEEPQISELEGRPKEIIKTYGSYGDAVLAAAKYVQTGKALDRPHDRVAPLRNPGNTMEKYKGTTRFKGIVGLGVKPKSTPLDFLRIDFVPEDENDPEKKWGVHFNSQVLKGDGNQIDTDKAKFAAYVNTTGMSSKQWETRFNQWAYRLARPEITAEIIWEAWRNGRDPELPRE
ncbi:hypothetical protein FRC06_008825, partial [Ceratobasidium sp. 370]